MDFPLYRKRFDDGAFYKITAEDAFEEVQLIGKRFFLHSITTDKYFEKLQIKDMIAASNKMYRLSNQEEFEQMETSAKVYLQNRI